MLLLIDESVKGAIVEALARLHDLRWVAQLNGGLDDRGVLTLARELGAVLLTEDREIPWTARLMGQRYPPGLVLFRLDGIGRDQQVERALAGIAEAGDSVFERVTIISVRGLRQKVFGEW